MKRSFFSCIKELRGRHPPFQVSVWWGWSTRTQAWGMPPWIPPEYSTKPSWMVIQSLYFMLIWNVLNYLIKNIYDHLASTTNICCPVGCGIVQTISSCLWNVAGILACKINCFAKLSLQTSTQTQREKQKLCLEIQLQHPCCLRN